ncbi:MAG: rod shape-determining protein MreD [Deltaproteobacteria bacterium]|jgi:cell shape-determining protein MreD|nr:rod shape-determining protein MreD [Deltaproteobacteria bacterium]
MEDRLKGLARGRSRPKPEAGPFGTVMVFVLALAVNFFYAAFKARFSGLGYFPDLLIIPVVWASLRSETFLAAAGAFVLGFFLDGLSYAPSGVMPLDLIVLVLAVRLLSKVLEFSSPFYIMCLNFFIFSLSNLVIYPLLIYISYGNLPFDVISSYFSIYCVQGVLTALAAPPAFWCLDRLTSAGD